MALEIIRDSASLQALLWGVIIMFTIRGVAPTIKSWFENIKNRR
jgi:hypothetical protein